MTQIKPALWLAGGLMLATFAAGAAETATANAASQAKQARSESRAPSFHWGQERPAATKSRLNHRNADGTCACSCARGGITEEEIRKAQEARTRAPS